MIQSEHLTATVSIPSGSDVPDTVEMVRVLGFVPSWHDDARGYGIGGDTIVAVIVMPDGRADAVPLSWLRFPTA